MKLICELNDKIILGQEDLSNKAPRLTARAIVKNASGQYAVMYSEKFRLHSLPGGSFAVTAWNAFSDPVAAETIRADAGMDIGGTLIGIHLRQVAVPVRTSLSRIGEAIVLCARTCPKYNGGPRAVYQEL